MVTSDKGIAQAGKRMEASRGSGYAVSARYERRTKRIVVRLDSGLELAFPPDLAEGLAGASPEALAKIEISASGLGLHWPALDADLYLPALMQGVFGSRQWMAARLGAAGGRVYNPAKAASSRKNGRKGGRPKRQAG